MIDPGVQQLHHQHHAALLGMAEDALESRLGIGHAVLRVHAVAVAGEADEIAIAGIGDQIDVPRVALHQLIVELAASKALGQAQLCAVAHRAVHVMGLQRRPVLRADQVDGGEADVLHRAAELGHRQLREGPARDGMLEVALERRIGCEGREHACRTQADAAGNRKAQRIAPREPPMQSIAP
ncbi:hypothetical protein G6F68_014692 [Rhizopus microsporus]|nr:hypothetical protein G6F68_014692 [Rhizopus microsporus]